MSSEWLKTWASDPTPLQFTTEILGAKPEAWQAEALELFAKHDRLSIRAGHGVGKSTLDAWCALWFLVTRFPCKIPITANSQDQLRDVEWAELGTWFRRLPEGLRTHYEFGAERLFLKAAPEEAFAVARTASKDRPEALQGFHSQNLLFIIAEASGIVDIVFEVAQGALSTPGAKALMNGNPTRLSGFFYDSHHRLRDRWKTMRVNSEDVPRARGHIQDIIARYGKDSNAYKVRVLGEFPTTEDEQVIPLEWIEAAVKRKVDGIARYQPVWGVDVARFGDDRTALAKRQANKLLEPVKSWRGKDTMQVAGIIKNEFDETLPILRPAEILVDVIGIGAGVVDRLRELGLPVRGINVGEAASASDKFQRYRDELWWKGRDWFGAKDCAIPQDDALISELVAPTYTFTSSGKIAVESKQDMKDRGINSPDLADAFLLTLATGLGVPMPEREIDRYARRRGSRAGWMSA